MSYLLLFKEYHQIFEEFSITKLQLEVFHLIQEEIDCYLLYLPKNHVECEPIVYHFSMEGILTTYLDKPLDQTKIHEILLSFQKQR